MIGVKYSDVYAVTETFQLLKTDWEWYNSTKTYDVVIAKKSDLPNYTGNIIDLTDNDVFKKIRILLNDGQEHLHEPYVEIYIDYLRSEIKKYVVLVEIPPMSWGYPYMLALTHDVDNVSVIQSPLRSVCMAALRCFMKLDINSGLNILLSKIGLKKDPWLLFEWWHQNEHNINVRSTFFIIPPHHNGIKSHKYRESAYTFNPNTYNTLWRDGWELGVHGINNWISPAEGSFERGYIGDFIGNRTHWLLHDETSWELLDKSGYKYDTTFGYDDDVGYRAGTTQVYKPYNVKSLLELPLHIQDTALFGKSCWIQHDSKFINKPCLNLSESAARKYCEYILSNAKRFGGVVTVLWHYENVTAPRNWQNTYWHIISKAKSDGAWITTAGNIVDWFQLRRDTNFTYAIDDKKITIRIKPQKRALLQIIRIHIDPAKIKEVTGHIYVTHNDYIDIRHYDSQKIEVILC